MSMSWREAAGRALLVLLSVGLTLALLEGVARLSRRLRPPDVPVEAALYTEFDPLLGWRKRPRSQVTYKRREYRVEVAINSHGLRDPERNYSPPPGVFRV